jgi:hypothetical protein
MGRVMTVFVAGAVAALVGVGLILGAHGLATQWQDLGNGAWGGTTDPAKEAAYRTVGLAVLIFGLVMETLAFTRWLRARGQAVPR